MQPLPSASSGRLDSRPGRSAGGSVWGPGVHVLSMGDSVEARLAVPAGADAGPLLVFFHGAGGTGTQSISLIGEVAGRHGVAVLAPTSIAATWDLLAGGLGRDVAVLDAALAQVFAGRTVTGTAFGGFSDGASYALSLGLANGDLVEAVLAFSPGFVRAPRPAGEPRVWVAHGRSDRVLPIDRCGRRVVAGLLPSYDVTFEEFDGGHVVPPQLADAAFDWWLRPSGAR